MSDKRAIRFPAARARARCISLLLARMSRNFARSPKHRKLVIARTYLPDFIARCVKERTRRSGKKVANKLQANRTFYYNGAVFNFRAIGAARGFVFSWFVARSLARRSRERRNTPTYLRTHTYTRARTHARRTHVCPGRKGKRSSRIFPRAPAV